MTQHGQYEPYGQGDQYPPYSSSRQYEDAPRRSRGWWQVPTAAVLSAALATAGTAALVGGAVRLAGAGLAVQRPRWCRGVVEFSIARCQSPRGSRGSSARRTACQASSRRSLPTSRLEM